jgi:hypothetical protein
MRARNLLLLILCAAAPSGRVVSLTAQPGSTLEHQAQRLMASDIKAARHAHERPLVLVGSAKVAEGAGDTALFIQVQSAVLCGSAGCSTSVFLPSGQSWRRVLDSVSGPIEVGTAMHAGMHDLIVDGRDRWVWDGHTYRDTLSVRPPKPAMRH